MTPSNANTSGLAPCPFCGGEAWLNDYEAKYSDLPPMSRAPQCRSCGASLGYLTTPAKATEAWNRRVTAASAQARIAELSERLEASEAMFRLHCGATADILGEKIAANDRTTAAEARADRLAKALEVFAKCADELDGCADVPRAPDGEWAKFRLLTDDYRAARAALQQETQP